MSLAKDSTVVLVAQLARMLAQAAYFILVARLLGSSGYGALASILAVVMLLAPFSTFGAINLMIRDVAIDSSKAPVALKTTLWVALLGGAALVLVSFPLVFVVSSGADILTVALISFSEIICTRVVEVAAAKEQALGRVGRMGTIQLAVAVARLGLSSVLVVAAGSIEIVDWSILYAVVSTSCAAGAVFVVRRGMAHVKADFRSLARRWREGIHFSLALSAQSGYNDFDKIVLARTASVEINGVYAAAYRLLDVAFAPARAVFTSTYSRFFRQGESGLPAAVHFAVRILPLLAGVTFGMASLLYFASPLIPSLLGSEYVGAIEISRLLAVVVVLRGAQYLAADTLTGAGVHGLRSTMQLLCAGLNLGLCLILIPTMSWRGAVYATLTSELVLAVLLWCGIVYKLRRRHVRVAGS